MTEEHEDVNDKRRRSVQ